MQIEALSFALLHFAAICFDCIRPESKAKCSRKRLGLRKNCIFRFRPPSMFDSRKNAQRADANQLATQPTIDPTHFPGTCVRSNCIKRVRVEAQNSFNRSFTCAITVPIHKIARGEGDSFEKIQFQTLFVPINPSRQREGSAGWVESATRVGEIPITQFTVNYAIAIQSAARALAITARPFTRVKAYLHIAVANLRSAWSKDRRFRGDLLLSVTLFPSFSPFLSLSPSLVASSRDTQPFAT